MNKNHLIQSSNEVRFRRWTRKNYAIFAGLNKIISIGRLALSICETTFAKAKLTSLESGISVSDFATDVKAKEEKELVIQELLFEQNNIITISADAVYAPAINLFNSRLNFR